MAQPPEVVLRMGTHAEKDYVEKMAPFLDGVMVGANLVESTPGATASLFVRLAGERRRLAFYVDPMTYAFGLYIDPSTGTLRNDLDWIKSEQKHKGKVIREYKRSYRGLADAFGPPFTTALERGTAVTWNDFRDLAAIDRVARQIVDYQLSRIRGEFEKDEEFSVYAQDVPGPAAVFAPYFYCDPRNVDQWLTLNVRLARATAALANVPSVHAVFCADESVLQQPEIIDRAVAELPDTGVNGVWLWLSRFMEDAVPLEDLRTFRRMVERLGHRVEVFNMHGGFFSLALANDGMRMVSHGVGYGEQKDVVPVIGQSTPTVRYYLPPLRKRLGVLEIERCFDALGVDSPEEFHETVCDCVVCKGIVSEDLAHFQAFGETHYSVPDAKRESQTPAAAKRCRFHFLLSRIRERDWVRRASRDEIRAALREAYERWASQPSINRSAAHLERWHAALA